ncbi:SMP-30/gluconolactonase/LRE family protein [Streptomyces sp. OE57]|uniref:SMP-30/gluconolactonase/LRE family protein n=1 Tax=Streptomyces lacaronensis TaxID=3379885 RepID=UPI0039B72FC8
MREFMAAPCSETGGDLPEGPGWDASRAELQWVDIYEGVLHRASANGVRLREVRRYHTGVRLGAAVPASEGGWLLAVARGFAHLSANGTLTSLHELDAHRGDNMRMNDGACDPQGRFWAGSLSYDKSAGAGTVYRMDLDGTVTPVLGGVTVSNGIGWSPGGDTMYHVDTAVGTVTAFDFDGDDGRIGRRRQLVRIDPREGAPDGLAVDDDGCLWVALWRGGQVRRFDPTGRHLATVHLPVTKPTACTFGGSNGRTLYITTARFRLRAEELAAQPDAGRLFMVEAGVSGPARSSYRGLLRTEHRG